jgi:type 1 glutamine amidotransferase
MQALDAADLCVMQLRFREWPDEEMKHFVDYVNSGKPIIALRTSTHAFAYSRNKNSPFAKYDWSSSVWPGGFGRQVLGDTWISHHGDHGKESTRGVVNLSMQDDPILRGVTDLWCPSDVYTVTHLPEDAQVLVWGQVLSGMKPDDTPVAGAKNDPLMPLVWTREYKGDEGRTSKIIATTAGAAVDLQNEGFRRLLVNACYCTTGLADKLPAKADVDYVDPYAPSFFGFGKGKKGVKPSDLKTK